MIDPERLVRLAAARLRTTRARWAMIGGIAVAARTVPRFTQDVDIAVAVRDDHEAEQIVADLAPTGLRVATLLEQTATGRLATVRLSLEYDDNAVIDLLFASCGIEPEVVAAATVAELVRGLRVPVATIGHLIALKVLSRNDDTRPQDIVDLRALIVEATDDDLTMARDGLALIAERGFDRGKSLQTDLDALLDRFRPTG
jgi:predicted nucleotidyltransferase